jgi:ABC transporter substrate binding protein (PQQ-dependent alcohol dehydrogenase system)
MDTEMINLQAGTRRAWLGSAAGALAALALPLLAQAAGKGAAASPEAGSETVALIGLADDPRHAPRRLERAYPGHPGGRLLEAVQLGIADSEVALRGIGRSLKMRDVLLPDLDALPAALAQLSKERVAYWLLDLPPAAIVQAARAAGNAALLFNLSAMQDSLRGADCAAQLLHTMPSQTMLHDALSQYLAARSWRKVWVLHGPGPDDALLLQTWNRAASRYGIKSVGTKPFKLSGDPRERDLANTRLLTSDREHDVVVVLDADGEFARTLPYATQQPRPVVGSNGLNALAWHPQWERNGGPQVSRRFRKMAGRAMTGQDWSAWIALRSITAVLGQLPTASVAEQARALRGGQVFVDGAKGPRLSYRAWDGQLRQPVFLAHGDGVIGVAPMDGVLHPLEQLDTLGVDRQESTCKAAP